MKGKLYGVGVGPGDPELLTLQAVRIIRESDVILVPGKVPRESVAWQIARAGIPELEEKETVGVEMPMTREKERLQEAHRKARERICGILDEGKRAAFLTLGDPTVYSTYLYVHRQVQEAGYETQIVNGIPSFLAAAARLNEGLVENTGQLHVIPAPDREALKLPGTRVFMQAGNQTGKLKKLLEEADVSARVVERCGMEGERVWRSAKEMPAELSYYSLVIVKDREEE